MDGGWTGIREEDGSQDAEDELSSGNDQVKQEGKEVAGRTGGAGRRMDRLEALFVGERGKPVERLVKDGALLSWRP